MRVKGGAARYAHLILLAMIVFAGAGIVFAAGGDLEEGRIGPDSRIQPSGRLLDPVGKLTTLGNLPAGGALTVDGRFAWTLSAGRGKNDIRIVRVLARRCPKGHGERARGCRKQARKAVGRVVQKIPMPGLSGGIAMSPDGTTAYVSGVAAPASDRNKPPPGTPGADGDVIHVFELKRSTGKATRDGVIEVPPPPLTLPPQAFPPTTLRPLSWPRDLAVSPDGKTLLAALNLANQAAIVDTATREVRYADSGRYPYGAAITGDGKLGLVSSETEGKVTAIDLASATRVKQITVGPHLSHPEGIAVDPTRPLAYVAVAHTRI